MHLAGLGTLAGRSTLVFEAALQFGVDGLGLGELILENDDATCGIQSGAAVHQLTGPRGDPELISGVPPVPAL